MNNEVTIQIDEIQLSGNLTLPAQASGLVIFAHGSGSGRFSPRNQYVAQALTGQQLGTLLFDLLTPEEENQDNITLEYRFDIGLLATRLVGVVNWVHSQTQIKNLPIGLFGSSTGAAAALVAAGKLTKAIKAVVSRGGRPDLAKDYLIQVTAPILLIVGQRDEQVIELNKEAQRQLTAPSELVIIPNATHLFEEEGTLDLVIQYANDWFTRHLQK